MSKYSGYMLKNSVAGEATPPATPVAMAATVLVALLRLQLRRPRRRRHLHGVPAAAREGVRLAPLADDQRLLGADGRERPRRAARRHGLRALGAARPLRRRPGAARQRLLPRLEGDRAVAVLRLHQPARRPRRRRDRHGAGGGADQPLVRAPAQHRDRHRLRGLRLRLAPDRAARADADRCRRLAPRVPGDRRDAARPPAGLAGGAVANDPRRPAVARRAAPRASLPAPGRCARRCATAPSGASCR